MKAFYKVKVIFREERLGFLENSLREYVRGNISAVSSRTVKQTDETVDFHSAIDIFGRISKRS